MAIAFVATGCAAPDVAPKEMVYSGVYRQGFEQAAFYPDTGGGPHWLMHEGDNWPDMEPYMTGDGRGRAAVVRMTVVGAIQETDAYAFMGSYKTELRVSEVRSIEASTEEVFQAAAARVGGGR